MERRSPRSLIVRGFRSVREAGTRRLVLTGIILLAALAMARLSWLLPVTDEAENRLYDLRSFVLAPQVPQDRPQVGASREDVPHPAEQPAPRRVIPGVPLRKARDQLRLRSSAPGLQLRLRLLETGAQGRRFVGAGGRKLHPGLLQL